MTVKKLLYNSSQKLISSNIKSASLDAEILLSHTLNKDKVWLYTHPEYSLKQTELNKFNKYLKRRLKCEPIAYITGHKQFYNLNFYVNKNAIIPRPATELMVENVIKEINNTKDKIKLIDIGTGSGCIPISILKNIQNKNINAIAADISAKSLYIARKNAKSYKLDKKIKFIQSNLLTKIRNPFENNTCAIITANLPYISENIYKSNYINLKYESKNALVAKNNGLDLYEKLLTQINKLKLTNATVYLEIDPSQSRLIKNSIKQYLPSSNTKIKTDLAKLDRMVIITC